MHAIIFANGMINPSTMLLHSELETTDLLIAADGGARHCLGLGLIPHLIVGDFDSLSAEELRSLESVGAEVIRYPTRKDYTDLELALLIAKERGAARVTILGALGQRWDQTLANLLLPAGSAFASLRISLVDGPQEILLVQPGEPLDIQGLPGDTLSLIPIMGDARGITTQGLEYPLRQETLLFGSTRGVSNVLLGKEASISLREGLLLCVLIHEVGKNPQAD